MTSAKERISEICESEQLKDAIEISDSIRLLPCPLVSVVVITYNHERYIAEAIDGILEQRTDFPFEIIVGDDGSTDNTGNILRLYQNRFPHLFRIAISKKNAGPLRNTERALSMTRGKMIALCEGDDYWIDKHKLATQANKLQHNRDIDICYHACYTRYANSKELHGPYIGSKKAENIFKPHQVIRGGGGFMPTASLMFRREVLDSIPNSLRKEAPMLDYLMQVYGSRRGGALYINKPMCVYRRGHFGSWNVAMGNSDYLSRFENLTNTTLIKMAADLREFKKDFYDFIFQYNLEQLAFHHHRNDQQKISIYTNILLKSSQEFSHLQKIALSICRNRAAMRTLYMSTKAIRKSLSIFKRNKYFSDL
jgi:glycosyltransferase involved in cell wall biosynthesis